MNFHVEGYLNYLKKNIYKPEQVKYYTEDIIVLWSGVNVTKKKSWWTFSLHAVFYLFKCTSKIDILTFQLAALKTGLDWFPSVIRAKITQWDEVTWSS